MQDNKGQRQVDGIIVPEPLKAVDSKVVIEHEDVPTEPTSTEPQVLTKPRWFNRKRVMWAALSMVALGAGLIAFKLFFATHKVITRNVGGGAPALAGELDPTKLRGEGDGRVNILLLGIGGEGHQGSNLSDTIMVLSIDPRTKDVSMLSLPRDLYVPIPGYGKAKINAAHAYGESERYVGGGPALAKKTVSELLDLPIHYFARIDFRGFKKAIDAVGGIDINVDKNLYDPAYPDESRPGRTMVLSIKAGKQHMDGATALRYTRSRHSTSDFDRAKRQQQVLLALRQKALGLKFLSNPAKISEMIDLVGTNAKTDIQLFELKKLADIAKDIDPDKMVTKVLDTSEGGLLKFAAIAGAGSTVVPKAGINDFSEIRAYAHSIFADGYIKEENALVEVANATGRSGAAGVVAKQLKDYHYNVASVTTAPVSASATVLYDYSKGQKPYTIRYLEQRFGVKAKRAIRPSGTTADIKLVLGTNFKN